MANTELGYLEATQEPPKRSRRFLKRYVLPSDNHEFIGRVYDLSIVQYNFNSYQEVCKYPDCKYALDVNFWLSTMVQRVESLNIAGNMLWIKSENLKKVELPISKYQWLNVAADVFLMRYISVFDCAQILTNEVYEANLEPKKCNILNLRRAGIPQRTLKELEILQNEQGEFRYERNARFHRGLEREFSSDDLTFQIAALYEHRGSGLSGVDQYGRQIDLNMLFKEGLVELQRDFNSAAKTLVKSLDRLYGLLGLEFEDRFSPKFNDKKFGFRAVQSQREHGK